MAEKTYRERVVSKKYANRIGCEASHDICHSIASEADAELAAVREELRISRQSEKEAWRYLPEVNAELAACRARIAELEAKVGELITSMAVGRIDTGADRKLGIDATDHL